MLRLRQVAIVARDRDAVTDQLHAAFGIEVAFHDPAIEELDLRNSVLPVGEQFIEVVAPTRTGTTASRFLDRRGGDAGYMLIFQTDHHASHRQVVEELGVRVVATFDAGGFRNLQLHPRDTGGAFFEIDEQQGEHEWHPAGPDWRDAVRLDVATDVRRAEIRCADPERVARRWAQLLLTDAFAVDEGCWALRVDDANIVFVPDAADDGFVAVTIGVVDVDEVVARAAEAGVVVDASSVRIGGLRFDLEA